MKHFVFFFLCFLLLLCAACRACVPKPETTIPVTVPETWTVPAAAATVPSEPETVPVLQETDGCPEATEPVIELTEKEKRMLLKLGMAERGNEDCTECIALVMRTVLNRVESGGFGNSISSVISAQGQFTPVTDGTYHSADPNLRCYEALDMVIHGWDESQGALFYEWCEGESWHSQNLQFLFQHCNSRFYR